MMNLVDGEDLCVRYQDAQESEMIVVVMEAVIVLPKHVYVIQVCNLLCTCDAHDTTVILCL